MEPTTMTRRFSTRGARTPALRGVAGTRIIGWIGIALLAVIVLSALLAPLIAPYEPFKISGKPLSPPGSEGHLFGTDNVGRDIFSYVLYGAQISLWVGVSVAVAALVIGSVIGGLSGYYGGRIDQFLVKVMEFFQVMPGFVLALVIVAIFGQSMQLTIVALAAAMWPRTARIVRAQVMSFKEREFVESLRSQGFGSARILWREILPNALPPAIIQATLDVGIAILYAAGLSFLGLGDPNLASWGAMLNTAQHFLTVAPWISIVPGLLIFVTVLAVNLVGDFLNDRLNPGKLEV